MNTGTTTTHHGNTDRRSPDVGKATGVDMKNKEVERKSSTSSNSSEDTGCAKVAKLSRSGYLVCGRRVARHAHGTVSIPGDAV